GTWLAVGFSGPWGRLGRSSGGPKASFGASGVSGVLCTEPIKSAKNGPVVQNGLVLMKRIATFAAFAVFVFLVGSSTAIAEQGNDTGPVRLNAPRGQAPVPAIKPVQENRNPKQIWSAPAPGNV